MPATRERPPRGGRHSTLPSATGVVAALVNWRPSGPTSCTPSTTKAEPGLISSSCWPAGSAIGVGLAGPAGIGSPSSSAPTVVAIDVCTNRPATAMIGPRPHGSATARSRLRAASAAPIGWPCPSSTAISARPGGLSWSKPSAVRSMTSSHSRMDTLTVSVTRGRRATVCAPPSLDSRRTCGPSPRSTATNVGCAGSIDELGVTRSAGHLARAAASASDWAVCGVAPPAAARSTRCADRRRWPHRRSRARR